MGFATCCGKFTLFIVSLLVLAIGIVGIVVGAYSLARYQAPGNLLLGCFIALVVTGVFAIITGCLGFACTCTKKIKTFYAFRGLAILTLILAAVTAGLATYMYTKYEDPSDQYLLQVWNDFPQSFRDSFMMTYSCNSFEACLPSMRTLAKQIALGGMVTAWVLFGLLIMAVIFGFSIDADGIQDQVGRPVQYYDAQKV